MPPPRADMLSMKMGVVYHSNRGRSGVDSQSMREKKFLHSCRYDLLSDRQRS